MFCFLFFLSFLYQPSCVRLDALVKPSPPASLAPTLNPMFTLNVTTHLIVFFFIVVVVVVKLECEVRHGFGRG